MKIAFDYDGTIDTAYPLFSAISNALIKDGHEVYIITHIMEEYRAHRERQLKCHNIAYTELVISGQKHKDVEDREIDYIFDDVSEYFKNTAPLYFKIFPIPKRTKKSLDDGELEITVFANFKLSGIAPPEYAFRYKRHGEDFCEWIRFTHNSRTSKTISSIYDDMCKFKTIEDVEKLWLNHK